MEKYDGPLDWTFHDEAFISNVKHNEIQKTKLNRKRRKNCKQVFCISANGQEEGAKLKELGL